MNKEGNQVRTEDRSDRKTLSVVQRSRLPTTSDAERTGESS